MNGFEIWLCVIASVYVLNEVSKNIIATLIAAIDLNMQDETTASEEEEIPEHVKNMYT